MCLVELKGSPKPVASCMGGARLPAQTKGEPPEVLTKTAMVRKAREGVMEFLLINHPLDCPICDQGGECDLQDQAMAYGVNFRPIQGEQARGRGQVCRGPGQDHHKIQERLHPLHALRPVHDRGRRRAGARRHRARRGHGDHDLSRTGHDLELQGNVVDLCPVGALTSKPYAFAARPWELNKTKSINVMDAVGSAIRIDTRGREVMRILPRVNDDVNEEWISDKTRHVVDGLRTQRLDQPYVREGGQLYPASWRDAFEAIAAKIKQTEATRIGAIVGDLAAVEEIFALKDLMTRLDVVNLDCRQDGAALDPTWGRAGYSSTPPLPESGRPTHCSSSPRIRGARRPCSMRASASAGVWAPSRSA